MIRPDPPFERTRCDCSDCKACCHRQPGHLIPGDLERIALFLGKTLDEAKKLFWSSPGALVLGWDGKPYRIRTITPRFDKKLKRCVFLDDADACTIHAVAPFGCAYADTHMTAQEWQGRGQWGLRLIAQPEYQEQRKTLPEADHYIPTRAV